ncbi:MAG TPA: hypothetical protein VFT01_03770 [Homoserinimonas sp.]|nr:hypothetical protein [Homoserinimonas sp.]
MDDAEISDSIRQTLATAVERLRTADAHDEALAIFIPRRRLLLFTKEASFIPLGRVWRLGVFLLDREETLYQTGSTTRAVAPGHPGFQSNSAEERRGHRAAAFKGPFSPGETVNFGANVIDLDAEALRISHGPLFLADDKPLVRWNPTATVDTAIPFDAYLAERVSLLVEPPAGA